MTDVLICGDCGALVDEAEAAYHPEEKWPLCIDCREAYDPDDLQEAAEFVAEQGSWGDLFSDP